MVDISVIKKICEGTICDKCCFNDTINGICVLSESPNTWDVELIKSILTKGNKDDVQSEEDV
jgi:hypothetical protein